MYIIPLDKHISPAAYLVYVVAVADVTIVVAAVGNVADGRRVAHGETILHTTLWANLSQIFSTLLTSFFSVFLLRKKFASFTVNIARGCSWSDVRAPGPGAPMAAGGQGGPGPTCHSSARQSPACCQHKSSF